MCSRYVLKVYTIPDDVRICVADFQRVAAIRQDKRTLSAQTFGRTARISLTSQ
jgi:hypothetical protein